MGKTALSCLALVGFMGMGSLALGQSFTIITGGPVSGAFDRVLDTDLGNDLTFSVIYDATSVTLLTGVIPEPATATLLVAGLVALATRLRRRRRVG